MSNYYQKEIETMPYEELRQLQNERLVKQVRHVWDNVPYYRKKMEEKGVTPDDIQSIDDLHKLPFLKKDDLREAYPYGLMGKPMSECVRIHSTSGTTGKRVVAFYTQHDVDLWEDCCARAIVAAGGTKEDVVHVAYGYGLFTGGAGLHGGSHKVGCLTLPMSSGNTDRQLQFMTDLGSTILCCTPSYAAYLAESIQEQGLQDQIRLKAGIFGAEAWSEDMRRDIENKLGIKAYDIYGLTELSGPGVSFECSEQAGMHVNEDHFIAEIIDPDTGEVLPDGTKGELVGDMNGDIQLFSFDTKQWTTVDKDGNGAGIESGHGGGDTGIMEDLYEYVANGVTSNSISGIDISVMSHLVAFAAEEARVTGKVIDMDEYVKSLEI